MMTLIKYESIKLLRKKSTLIALSVSLLITTSLFGLPILQYQAYNQDGVILGLKGIAYEKERQSQFSVVLTDEYITSTICEYQKLFENPDNVGYDGNDKFLIGDAYWNFVAPRERLLRLIAANYSEPGVYSGLSKLLDLDMELGIDIYKRRSEKIETLLNTPSLKLSEKQKNYWLKMSNRVKTPFQYGFFEGWEIIISCFDLLIIVILSVCFAIAPVFCGEYQAGTDALILSGKYGKTKVITAKIASSFIFGILSFTLHILLAYGLPLAAFGTDGWNLPVQIANTAIPYPFTFFKTVIINTTIIYLVLIAMISLTLLLSAKMKSTYLVLMVLVAVLIIPLFLSPNGTTGVYNLILFLLPYRSIMPELSNYISCQFGNLVLDIHTVRSVLYPALTVIILPIAGFGFKKHQVSA